MTSRSRTCSAVPIIDKEFDEDKLSILDVRARDDHGQWLNIEMQTTLPGELPERLAYYVAAQYVKQMTEGDSYRQLTPSIGICVLDGTLFPRVPDLHLDFRLRAREPGIELTNRLQIHLLELPKYVPPSDNGLITDPIEKWAFFFQQAVSLTSQELTDRLGDDAFAEAAGVLEMIARSPKDRELYESRLKLQRDEQSRIEAARDQSRAEGKAEGQAEGRVMGRIQLLQQWLDLPESPESALEGLTLDQLATLEGDLQRQMRERR